MKRTLLIFLIILMSYYNAHAGETFNAQERTFALDKNGFIMDGKPFRYISGSLHYFRVLPSSWRDRLRKMRYAGLNTVQTYTIWSSHEPEPGSFTFTDRLDLVKFIEIAQEEGLYVIIRPGPYIDAEVDMGGLPYWLLREEPNMKLRSFSSGYIKFVEKWMNVVLQKIKPLLYQNGGPIIMVQIENEYGSYKACDFKYTTYLRDLTKSILDNNVVLFTTDGNSANYLKCGKISGVYATVDFAAGVNINKSFEAQRLFEPEGPLVNSEFYTGWLDHYGAPHSTVNSWIIALYLDRMLAVGASVNFYVFHGGTSFGMLAGSNIINDKFLACPTSYDYDAPLNEAGDPTEKYFVIRNVIRTYTDLPPGPVPAASEKYSYGKVVMLKIGSLPQLLQYLPIKSSNSIPESFEALSVANGIVAYQTKIKYLTSDPSPLNFGDIRDRGYIFIDDTYFGLVSRDQMIYSLGIYAKPNQTLTVIVESMGRVCFGEHINDWKGIGKVTLSGIRLEDWDMIPVPLENLNKMKKFLYKRQESNSISRMSFYEGKLKISSPNTLPDTFLKQDNWSKGYVWINGFLLGRYWPAVGPQMTLYIPGEMLQNGINKIRVLELEGVECKESGGCYVELVSSPKINGRTPFYK